MLSHELAKKHPILYHSTRQEAMPSIRKHGLLTTNDMMDLFELSAEHRSKIERKIRSNDFVLEHPVYGTAVITDNIPMSEKALTSCLDDGLVPGDWLDMLNRRVFFWPDEKNLSNHL